jgi:hypothetical protein
VFNNWKLLCSGKINEVDSKLSYPLLRWMSGKESNLDACANIDTLFFKVPPAIIISLLYTNCKGGYFKYPKATKALSSEKEILLKEKIKLFYKWSNSEYEKNKIVIEFIDINKLNKIIGFDKKECKILGVKYEEKKYKFTDKPRTTGLEGFM